MSIADTDGVSGYVLAGGGSSRLGRDKVLLPWMNGTLLDQAMARLQQVCSTANVCGNRPDLREYLPPSVRLIPDATVGCGPLGGIVTALESSTTKWNLFLAVDLPLIPVAFLQQLIAFAVDRRWSMSEPLCALPRVENLPQPLCGLYHRSLAIGLRRAFEEGKYKIMHALQDAVERNAYGTFACKCSDSRSARNATQIAFLDMESFISPSGLTKIDPKDWFLNINTEADLLRARDLAHLDWPGA